MRYVEAYEVNMSHHGRVILCRKKVFVCLSICLSVSCFLIICYIKQILHIFMLHCFIPCSPRFCHESSSINLTSLSLDLVSPLVLPPPAATVPLTLCYCPHCLPSRRPGCILCFLLPSLYLQYPFVNKPTLSFGVLCLVLPSVTAFIFPL